MKRILFTLLFSITALNAAEREIGLTLGALSATDRQLSVAGRADYISFSKGTALQANYAQRLVRLPFADLLGEVHLLASPQQQLSAQTTSVTRDIAVLYITPGVRLKFLPGSKVSPWLAAGGGYSLYEQSTVTIAGSPNGAPRHTSGGVLQFGGGVDVKVLPWVSLRGELRDFFTGSPKFNLPVTGTGQNQFVAGGGFVLRFGK